MTNIRVHLFESKMLDKRTMDRCCNFVRQCDVQSLVCCTVLYSMLNQPMFTIMCALHLLVLYDELLLLHALILSDLYGLTHWNGESLWQSEYRLVS